MPMRLHLHALTDNATGKNALGNIYVLGNETCPWIASTLKSCLRGFFFILVILFYECISLIFPKLEIRSLQNVQAGLRW